MSQKYPLKKSLVIIASTLLISSKALHGQAYDSTSLSFHFQQTLILQNHNRFTDPYSGINSLASSEPPALTATSTFFFHISLRNLFDAELDPELAGGKGLSGSTGIAGFPNGEAYRVSDAAPKLELVRAYLHRTIEVDSFGQFDFVAGKFSVADYFDLNTYSNSPRTQFMNWALINNGAWDYPADTRGYTGGFVVQYQSAKSSVRFASVLEPTSANGPNLDGHISKAHGEALEGETGYSLLDRGGKIRLLLWYNSAKMGNYDEATNDTVYHHDIALTREYGRNKYGLGINLEQSLSQDAGAFMRAGWNDGQNETWAYTEIDRTISGGVTSNLSSIGRREDNLGAAFTVNGISVAHRAYLNSGGYGFIIGDGKLPHYGAEKIIEAYYLFQLNKFLGISLDYQFVVNPAYNEDRGPVNFGAVRAHFEI